MSKPCSSKWSIENLQRAWQNEKQCLHALSLLQLLFIILFRLSLLPSSASLDQVGDRFNELQGHHIPLHDITGLRVRSGRGRRPAKPKVCNLYPWQKGSVCSLQMLTPARQTLAPSASVVSMQRTGEDDLEQGRAPWWVLKSKSQPAYAQ